MFNKLDRMVIMAAMTVAVVLGLLGGHPSLAVTYTAIDLNPIGFDYSESRGTSGTQQVGDGLGPATGSYTHALLWSGTAGSAVDLNPSGFDYSVALGISGTQQVGEGYSTATGGKVHALLWSGIAQSAVDLNPSGFDGSVASGISGTQQVGSGSGTATGGNDHALLWSGTAGSVVDLQQFLPGEYTGSSALAIDAQGNIVGYATIPTISGFGEEHAILWEPVPEPSTLVILVMGTFGFITYAWRRRIRA